MSQIYFSSNFNSLYMENIGGQDFL